VTNDNDDKPALERELRASVAFVAMRGVRVADVMPAERERTVREMRDEREEEAR